MPLRVARPRYMPRQASSHASLTVHLAECERCLHLKHAEMGDFSITSLQGRGGSSG